MGREKQPKGKAREGKMAGLMLGIGGEGIGSGLLAGGSRPSYFELFAQEWLMAG